MEQEPPVLCRIYRRYHHCKLYDREESSQASHHFPSSFLMGFLGHDKVMSDLSNEMCKIARGVDEEYVRGKREVG